jgi:AbrB family looped-hinge helix DNA binding protein
MEQVTVSSKYQVVIPKSVRERAKIEPGQKLMVMVKHGVISLVRVPELDELQGIAKGADTSNIREKVDRI